MIKPDNLNTINEKNLSQQGLVPLNVKTQEFEMLMLLYKKAQEDILEKANIIKNYLKETYDYDVINHITSRIKSPNSILNKMKKKQYELTYENLIENINDIAGVRLVCTFKNDIEKVINIIRKIPNTRIVKEKDFIKNPKKSGYSGYHIILEDFITYENDCIPIKVEIQIRTMAMDFWASTEHRMNYKTSKEISKRDSKKFVLYAKLINMIDNKIMKIYQKQIN